MSYLKIYEASTLLSSINERIKDYQNLQKQLEDLKGAFQEIVQLSDFKGMAAKAIKGFYRAQIDVVNAWEDFIEQHLSFLTSIESSVDDRNLSGNTLVHVPFLEETLKKATQKSNEIVSEKERELKRIFGNIDDIIALDVFLSTEFDHQMYLAEKERKDTLEKVHELDYDLVNRYQKSQPAETYAKLLFQQLLQSSTKNGIISPIHFNTKAYHNSDIYQAKKAELETLSKAKVEKSSQWYKVVGDILRGIGEGAWKAFVDIFKGLIDLAISLVTDPVNFFKGIMNTVTHPINTAKYMWNGIETAWKRDVVNGNARSRSEFFSYAAVSIIGLKGFDKVGKLGKLDKVSKAKPTIPYNVLNTEKLKGFIYNKVKTNFSNEKAKIVQFFKNKPVQITLNQAVRAVQNTKTLSTIKNVVNPNKFKYVFENTYRDVIKSPLTKTKAAIDQSIKSIIKKIGEVRVPTSFRVSQVSISGGFNFINVSTESTPLKDIVQKFNLKQEIIDININGTKDIGEFKQGDKSSLAPGGGLAAHEAKGGHLIERHVGISDEQLLDRLKSDPKISGSSTFTNRMKAEEVAYAVLSNPRNTEKIKKWISDPNSRPTLRLTYKGDGEIIGRSISRNSEVIENVTNAKIILKKDNDGGFILTGYPVK